VSPFGTAQIVGARFAFFVSLAHVKDRLKQGDGVFESGLGTRYFGFVWACLMFWNPFLAVCPCLLYP
jgi:hypothetical protein